MDYFYVDISTELGESLTTYVQAMDETAAEYQARMAFVNGELECEGTQVRRLFTSVLIGHEGKRKSPSLLVRGCTAKVHFDIMYFGGML